MVAGAVAVRALGLEAGRIGAPFGALILAMALAALVTGIAAAVGWRRALLAALVVTGVGGACEILGLYTGVPFGRYEYTDWWWPTVVLPGERRFPLLLPATWFILVASSYLVLANRLRGRMLVASTALLTALVDLASEAVLTNVVLLWRWLEPAPVLGAPPTNALGWLAAAGLGAAALEALEIDRARGLTYPLWMMAAGLVSVAVIGVTHGEARGAWALALVPVVVWAARGRAGVGPLRRAGRQG